MGSKKLRTPIIKPRTQGGTFYTFGSAMEDIGLNINELSNRVSLSHYVLLDLPEMPTFFDPLSRTEFQSVNVGDYKFAEGFENYVLNMETVMRNQSTYNFATSQTVSERVFWKWLSKSCMNFVPDASSNDYYVDSSLVVKGFGAISAGAQRTDDYSMYNETFVQIPSSYGQMKVLFKKVEDSNYFKKVVPYYSDSSIGLIENISESEIDASGNLHTGISGYAIYDDAATKSYTVNTDKDALCVEFSIDKLREYYGDDTLTYDDIALKESLSGFTNTNYAFNAILVYYSIYDSTGVNLLATNAYGVLLLNSCENSGTSTTTYKFPELIKSKSTSTTSGTSYAFRLNIKTSSVYSGDVHTNDNSTAAYSMATDFNDVIKNLASSINILRSNANLIAVISSDNAEIKSLASQAITKVDDLEQTINNLVNGSISKISTDSITTKKLDASVIMADSEIQDSDGNKIGAMTDDRFYYVNIKASEVESDSVETDMIITDTVKVDSQLAVKDYDSDEIYGKVAPIGVSSNNTYHKILSPMGSASIVPVEAVNEILTATTVKFDSSTYYINLPQTLEDAGYQGYLESLTQTIDGKLYMNVHAFLAMLTTKMKSFADVTAEHVGFTDASLPGITNVKDALLELNRKIEQQDSIPQPEPIEDPIEPIY